MDTNSQVWVESHDNNHLLSVTHSVTYIANILDTGANITCSASQACVYLNFNQIHLRHVHELFFLKNLQTLWWILFFKVLKPDLHVSVSRGHVSTNQPLVIVQQKSVGLVILSSTALRNSKETDMVDKVKSSLHWIFEDWLIVFCPRLGLRAWSSWACWRWSWSWWWWQCWDWGGDVERVKFTDLFTVAQAGIGL